MLEAHGVGYACKGSAQPVLRAVSFGVDRGERVCVYGRNGSGKSTLAQLIAGIIAGTEGMVRVDGAAVEAGAAGIALQVGYVAQDPRTQLFSTLVYDEVAFGLRCAGVACKQVRSRVHEALALCGIASLQQHATAELSKSQAQLVALAAALAPQPSYLVVDGPLCAQAAHVVDGIAATGMGVLEVAYSLERAAGAARALILDAGSIAWSGAYRELAARGELLAKAGLPAAGAVVPQGGAGRGAGVEHGASAPAHTIALDHASIIYGRHAVLDHVSLTIGDELAVLAGPVGSGATTCALAFAGAVALDEGAVLLDGAAAVPGSVGLLMQTPADQLVCRTARKDIALCVRSSRRAGGTDVGAVERAARRFGAEKLLDQPLRELSSGEQARVALAGLEMLDAAAYVLDNPCASLDAEGCALVTDMVQRLRAQHLPVVVIDGDAARWRAFNPRVVSTTALMPARTAGAARADACRAGTSGARHARGGALHG